MAQTLEAIRGGGGSIKVGTTGTISALMSREIESTKSASMAPSSSTADSVSVGETTPRRLKPRMSVGEGSSSSSNFKNNQVPETMRRAKHHTRSTHQIPMLTTDDAPVDGTPVRQKPVASKGRRVVEIADIKCGDPNKTWAGPIANRLKKFGFSKLSESII